MPRPCKECPFRRDVEVKYPPENVVVFIEKVCSSDSMQCHMTEADRGCVGYQEFMAGGNERCFGSTAELAQARDADGLATEFFLQLERLLASTKS
jgi:hypothetical protein